MNQGTGIALGFKENVARSCALEGGSNVNKQL